MKSVHAAELFGGSVLSGKQHVERAGRHSSDLYLYGSIRIKIYSFITFVRDWDTDDGPPIYTPMVKSSRASRHGPPIYTPMVKSCSIVGVTLEMNLRNTTRY